jgi:hypothetical protein
MKHQITKVLQEDEDLKPNPVTQRVKIIMVSCRLVTYRRLFLYASGA